MNEQPIPDAAGQPAPWRSLDELAATPEFRDFAEREFPLASALDPEAGVDRRRFLQLMAASLALGGLSGCRRPVMEILPYGRKPEEIVPGLPTFYATAIPRPGGCFPVLVESHEGRPTKIEGHPEYPHSKGRTDTFAQAAILDLYDPDRSRTVLKGGKDSTWADLDSWAANYFRDPTKPGSKLRFLVGDDTSPALRMLAERFPEAIWHVHEPLGQENLLEGSRLAFGKAMVPEYRLDQADVILVLDADPLGLDDNVVSHIAAFASRRVPTGPDNPKGMNRLYAVENSLTVTGSMADHRLPLPASSIPGQLKALHARLTAAQPSVAKDWIDFVADDLKAAPGRGLIIAGQRQPALVHALVASLNETLGATGKSVLWRERGGLRGRTIQELTKDIDAGAVETLVILGGNPVRQAPADLDFAGKLQKVKNTIHLGLYRDETAEKCGWHLPMSHFLESWGDAEAFDGTYSVVQPLIAPLHVDGEGQPLTRSALELLTRWTTDLARSSAYAVVLESFRKRTEGKGDEKAFRQVLHRGFLTERTLRLEAPRAQPLTEAMLKELHGVTSAVKEMELSFHGDYRVLDGRFANNAWLRETPDPVCKLTWDNAALISPHTANELKLETGDLVELQLGGRKVEIPVLVQPGQAKGSVSVHLGYGRSLIRLRDGSSERNGAGFDVYPLRTSASPWIAAGMQLQKTGKKYRLASTQNHGNVTENSKLKDLAERVHEVARVQTLEEFTKPQEHGHGHHSLPLITYPALDGPYQWGMVIDLSRCVGCNACHLACQAENNIPVVGKDEILRGREMYWIRIDRYYTGKDDNPGVLHQPVACVHCESASCETVCPVNAAVHSPEGLNVQVYNRCIGTRYCANNCPYKVRRFNWYDFHQRPLDRLALGPLAPKGKPETLKMQMNPDVTVRMRGVMEKCTYCVQRIERARIDAKTRNPGEGEHPIADGTVITACQQACPAGAIVFGDLKGRNSKNEKGTRSRVAQLRDDKRNYALLESVGTKPRTTYLLRLRNPNPKMSG